MKIFFTGVILLTGIKISAQINTIDFYKFDIGKYYTVKLVNGYETSGRLEKIQENTIILKKDSKLVKIKKADIDEMYSSKEILPEQEDDTNKVIIQLNDGSELIGHIRKADSLSVEFETLSGAKMVLMRNQIISVEQSKRESLIEEDPNKSRLFFAPTGRTLNQGDGYFSVYEIFLTTFAYGITDYISVAGGISLVPGADEQVFYFNSKVRLLHSKSTDLSAGIMYGNTTKSGGDGLGVIYAVGSFGTIENSITAGAGMDFVASDKGNSDPVFILGGEVKLSKSIKLISENWISSSEDSPLFFSLGLRFFGRKLAGDFGLVYITDTSGDTIEGWPFIPWIGLNYNF